MTTSGFLRSSAGYYLIERTDKSGYYRFSDIVNDSSSAVQMRPALKLEVIAPEVIVTFQTPSGDYLTSGANLSSTLCQGCAFRVESVTPGYKQYKLIGSNDYLVQRTDDKLFHSSYGDRDMVLTTSGFLRSSTGYYLIESSTGHYGFSLVLNDSSNAVQIRPIVLDEVKTELDLSVSCSATTIQDGVHSATVNYASSLGCYYYAFDKTLDKSVTLGRDPYTLSDFTMTSVTADFGEEMAEYSIDSFNQTVVYLAVNSVKATAKNSYTFTFTGQMEDGASLSTSTTAKFELAQVFKHTAGSWGRAKMTNGMQSTSTYEQDLYLQAGSTIQIPYLAKDAVNYARFYDYDTDGPTQGNIDCGEDCPLKIFTNGVKYYDTGAIHNSNVNYTMPEGANFSENIGLDYSYERYYTEEPTLEGRIIYHIHPASEMATKIDALGANEFLEHEVMEAPTTRTIAIGSDLTLDGQYAAYYANASSPVLLTDFSWEEESSKEGTTNSITPDYVTPGALNGERLMKVSSAVEDVITYRLYANYSGKKNGIKEITVNYKPVNTVGPLVETDGRAIRTSQDLAASYQLVAFRNFDYAITNTEGYGYDEPLPWAETAYGFNHNYKSLKHGTYDLLRSAKETVAFSGDENLAALENRSGLDKGYFYATDAGYQAIQFFDLKLDGQYCPNTTIYISAWVANLSSATAPNVNLKFSGISGGQATAIKTFTTGYLPDASRKTWSQVFFSVTLGAEAYDEYRIQFVNNCENANGNDLALDDIEVYAGVPPTQSFQAMVSCGANQTDPMVATLRVDYGATTQGPETLYYRWDKADEDNYGESLGLNYIHATTETSDQSPAGLITVDASLSTTDLDAQGEAVYRSLAELLENFKNSTANETYGFVEETCGTVLRPVLYIVHRSTEFKLYHNYVSHLTVDVPDFTNEGCSSNGLISVLPSSFLVLNSQQINPTEDQYCSELTNNIFSLKTVTGESNESYTVMTDWYRGDLDDYSGRVSADLLAFRMDYPKATSFDQAIGLNYTQDIKEALLILEPNFELYTKHLSVDFANGSQEQIIIAFPDVQAADSELSPCSTPLRVVLKTKPIVVFGDEDETLPTSMLNAPMPVRVAASTNATAIITLPVHSTDYPNADVLETSAILKSTTDSTMQDQVGTYRIPLTGSTLNAGNQIDLTADMTDLRGGYDYTFYVPSEGIDDEGGAVGNSFFTLKVVPETVVWNPEGYNQAWNNDSNWTALGGGQGRVPLSSTNVIINAGSNNPILPVSTDVSNDTIQSGAQENIGYEIGYEMMHANNIYFAAGAMLQNQHMLDYKSAWVDIDVSKDKYTLFSSPMQGIVTGDFYIPKEGYKNSIFDTMDTVDTRSINSFDIITYASTGYSLTENGKIYVSDANWSTPQNGMTTELSTAQGISVKLTQQNDSVPSIVRFPKSNSTYYYWFGPYINPYGQDFSRNPNYDRLAFEPDEDGTMVKSLEAVAPTSYFLVGNPFMAQLNMTKFFESNPLLDGLYWVYNTEGEMKPVSKLDQMREGALSCLPMHASFMVHMKDNREVSSLEVNFNGNMTQIPSSNTVHSMPIMNVSPSFSQLVLTTSTDDHLSTVTITEWAAASNSYVSGEDAELQTGNKKMTPAALYVVADSRALSQDFVNSVDMIALGYKVLDATKAEASLVQINVSGVNTFVDPLYLYDSALNTYTLLTEDSAFSLDLSEDQRYFIVKRVNDQTTGVDASSEKMALVIYTPQTGMAEITSTSTIQSITVYNVLGQTIFSQSYGACVKAIVEGLTPNNYIFKVVTTQGTHTQKVQIR